MKERDMVDGPNMYAYARNDPMNHRDPSGGMSVPPNLVNGGGGSRYSYDDCPFAGYSDYWACVDYYSYRTPPPGYNALEYCVHVCYETPGPDGMSDCMGYCSLMGCGYLCGIL
ncbi:MAG: hypothetical protein ACOC53_05135 [Candidatus Saliniplasma sp.]